MEVKKKTPRERRIERLRKLHIQANKKGAKAAATKRKKAEAAAQEKLEKLYGKSAVIRLAEHTPEPVTCVSTGFPDLDDALSGKSDKKGKLIPGSGRGLPLGRIMELKGPESSGKTTMTLEFIRAFQEAGMRTAFVDAEHSLDLSYAADIGVDVTDLSLSQPDSAEEALNVVDTLMPVYDLIVVDSVAALTPLEEQEKEVGEYTIGLQARLMGQALRKIATQQGTRSDCLVLFTNQLRMKIGVRWGSPETTPGGNALKFYASIRADIRKVQTLKKSSKAVGVRSRIKIVKNKIAVPFREMYVDIARGQGVVETHTTYKGK